MDRKEKEMLRNFLKLAILLFKKNQSNQIKLFLSSIARGVVAQSPEPEAHVLCVRAFEVELEFRNRGF